MSKETIEEAAERLKIKWEIDRTSDFIKGAAWQAERMYSEEDMRKAFQEGVFNYKGLEFGEKRFDNWFDQFKKQKS